VLSVDGDSDAVDSLADALEATGSYTEQLTFMHMVSIATMLLLQLYTLYCCLQACLCTTVVASGLSLIDACILCITCPTMSILEIFNLLVRLCCCAYAGAYTADAR
jgi:hypothetical protein